MTRKQLTKRQIQLRSAIKVAIQKSATGALRDVYKRLLKKRPNLSQPYFNDTIQNMRDRGDIYPVGYGVYRCTAAPTQPLPSAERLNPRVKAVLRAQTAALPELRKAAGMGPDLPLGEGARQLQAMRVDDELIDKLLKDRKYKQTAIVDSAILNLKLKVTVEVV